MPKVAYEFNLKNAEMAFGVARETIERAMRALGIKVEPHKKYPVREIHRALSGDAKFERARLTREQADAIALENAKTRGELITLEEARRVALQPWAAANDSLLACPHSLCARVNPNDPEHARTVLQEWSDQTRRLIHDKFLMGGEPEPAPEPEDAVGVEDDQ